MSCAARDVDLDTVHNEYLPILLRAAARISERLGAGVGAEDRRSSPNRKNEYRASQVHAGFFHVPS